MNRAIKDATAFPNRCESHDQFRDHLVAFVAAFKSLRKQKILSGLVHCWTIFKPGQISPTTSVYFQTNSLRG